MIWDWDEAAFFFAHYPQQGCDSKMMVVLSLMMLGGMVYPLR